MAMKKATIVVVSGHLTLGAPRVERSRLPGVRRCRRLLASVWKRLPAKARYDLATYWNRLAAKWVVKWWPKVGLHPGRESVRGRRGRSEWRWMEGAMWTVPRTLYLNAAVLGKMPDRQVKGMIAYWLAGEALDAAGDRSQGALRRCRVDNLMWRWGYHPFAKDIGLARKLKRWDSRSGPVWWSPPRSAEAVPLDPYDYVNCVNGGWYENSRGRVPKRVEAQLKRFVKEGTLPPGP